MKFNILERVRLICKSYNKYNDMYILFVAIVWNCVQRDICKCQPFYSDQCIRGLIRGEVGREFLVSRTIRILLAFSYSKRGTTDRSALARKTNEQPDLHCVPADH